MLWTFPIAIAVVGLAIAARRKMLRKRWYRLQGAIDIGAMDVARRELARLERSHAHHPFQLNVLELTEAWMLLEEEHYAEARKVLEAMDPRALDGERLAFYQAELAFCFAHTGDPDRALAFANAAIACAELIHPKLLAHCRAVLGVVLLRSGQPREAVEMLEQSLRDGQADAYGQAMRAFHLGEALVALGRVDQAQQAYDRARRALPHSRWSLRAEACLDALSSQLPYR